MQKLVAVLYTDIAGYSSITEGNELLVKRLVNATLICQQAVCGYGCINYNYNKLRSFLHDRPSFVLRKSTHCRWFDFYYASFRKMMDSDHKGSGSGSRLGRASKLGFASN